MKKSTCRIKGHQLVTISTDNVQLKEFECSRCNQQFTIDGYGNIVKLNAYWKENNRLFQQYFNKRQVAS